MYLGKSSGAIMPGRGLINPCFVIKIVAANDDMQQKPSGGRNNQSNDYLDDMSIGDSVTALIGKNKIIGKLQRIIKNQLGDGIYAIVSDSNGKSHKIEASRVSKTGTSDIEDDRESLMSTPGRFNESLMSYLEFSK